jgi:hypothetical protein
MRKFFIYIFLFIPFFLIADPVTSHSTTRGIRGIKIVSKEGKKIELYQDYHALVVGISNYEKWPKLPNSAEDAKEVAARLEELGFEVKLVLDPTSREMKTALSEMVYEMGGQENRAVLFYYAGHGETETLADKTKMGYIIPKDCPLLEKNPKGFSTHAISMRDLESVSLRIKAKHVLMLFDSCFSGSLFNLVRAVPHDITEKSALHVRQYITAGREDESVPDKSMFKRCFLIGLTGDADLTGDGYITGSELGMYLSDKVVNYSHRRQHPQYGKINNPDLDRGDFIFVPMKLRQKEEITEKKLQEDRSEIAEELKKLKEERRKSEELVKQLKHLLEAKSISEEKEKEDLDEKKDLEEKLKQADKHKEIDKELKQDRIRELEAKHKAANEKARKEAAEKKALEKELERLKAEKKARTEAKEKVAQEEERKKLKDETKKAGDKSLAYVPKRLESVYDRLRYGKGPFVIDDFEDQDLMSKYFRKQWLQWFKGPASINISVDPTQGANGTFCSMKLEYKLGVKSLFIAAIGGKISNRIMEIQMNKSLAYDFSRFHKIVFYLKGMKEKTFFSRPNKVFVTFACYDKNIETNWGKWADYYNGTEIIPDNEWKRIEIPFYDLVPSKKIVNWDPNYPSKPNLQNILSLWFMFSSFEGHGGYTGSNTVWIDEITLE